MIEAIIFDCDGVLFDSRPANLAYYNAVLKRLGLPPLRPEWEEYAHSLAAAQVFDTIFGPGSDRAQKARGVAQDLDYSPFYPLMKPVSGLYSILEQLKRTYRLAIASNRGRTLPEVVRRFGLDAYLHLAVGVLDVARPKPAPDMIAHCVAHLDVSPAAALYVGDSQTDLQAATAAAVHFVAVGEQSWAPSWVEHIRQLPNWLAQLPIERGPAT